MNPDQAAEHLRVIRELMERPIRQTTRSGLSGLVAGTLALLGSAATWLILEPVMARAPAGAAQLAGATSGTMTEIGLIWLTVLVLASGLDLLVTAHRARKMGITYWTQAQKQVGLAIAPALILGAVSTGIFVEAAQRHPDAYLLIPGSWMIFYGLALWSIGLFTIKEVRYLAAAFMIAGAVCHFQPFHPALSMAATFGGFHLVYGAVVFSRHGG